MNSKTKLAFGFVAGLIALAVFIYAEMSVYHSMISLPADQQVAVEKYVEEMQRLQIGDLVHIRDQRTAARSIGDSSPVTETFTVVDLNPSTRAYKLEGPGPSSNTEKRFFILHSGAEAAIEHIKNQTTVSFTRRGQQGYDVEMASHWLN